MTQTQNPATEAPMTPMEEEKLLTDKLLSARFAVLQAKKKAQELKVEIAQLEKYEAECAQAVTDYMTANGVKQFKTAVHSVTLGESFAVDIPDPKAVPEEYSRLKTTVEPNKALIAEMHKAGKLKGANWYTYASAPKVTISTL